MTPAVDHRDNYVDAAIEYQSRPVGIEVCVEHDAFLHKSAHVSDWAVRTKLRVRYRPSDKVLEWAIFGAFLDSLSQSELTLELAAARIYEHVDRLIRPAQISVELERVDAPGNVLFTVVASSHG